MARMPGAEWVGPYHDNGLMDRYDILCLHTIVGWAPAHAAHLSTRADGHIFQSRDTAWRSAANAAGNYRIIAVENEDHGDVFGSWSGTNVPAFTAAQIEALARICVWAYETHGIPLVLCPDSKPGSRGIAFHRQGIDGNFPNGRVPGGELWTESFGKVCPGDKRIAQLPLILNRARELAGIGDDMNKTQEQWLLDVREWVARIEKVVVSGQVRDAQLNLDLGYIKNTVNSNVDALEKKVDAMNAKLDLLLKK